MVKAAVVAGLALLAAPIAYYGGNALLSGDATPRPASAGTIAVTITSAGGAHVFQIEPARTTELQAKGLMYRTDIPKDGGMLFDPYPAEGGGPKVASFWMKNTPSPLDIIFIRPDRSIAHIAENTVPFSEVPVSSGEPVSTVLEINGGRSAELGIAEGDKVKWGK